MIVVGGSAGSEIGKNIAKRLKAKYFQAAKRDFSDGEFVMKLPFDPAGEDIVVVQSTYPPQDTNLMELAFIADLLKDMKAKSVTAVVPYLAYLRQDKRFLEGEAISAHTIMKMLNAAGVDKLVTVQPHKEEPLKAFNGEVKSVYPIMSLIKRVKRDVKNPFVLAPDKSGVSLAKEAAEVLGCDYIYLDKERDRTTGVPVIKNAPDQRLDGNDVVIVDDMISTGGTLVISSEFAYSRGARTVLTAATHLIMVNDAYRKLTKAGVKRIYGTNTIPFENAVLVDVSEDIAAALK